AAKEPIVARARLIDDERALGVLEGDHLLGPVEGHREGVVLSGAVELLDLLEGLEDAIDFGLRHPRLVEGDDEGAPLHLAADQLRLALQLGDAPRPRKKLPLALLRA